MKLYINEKMCKITYPETTDIKTPTKQIKTKSALKKVRPTPSDNSTK